MHISLGTKLTLTHMGITNVNETALYVSIYSSRNIVLYTQNIMNYFQDAIIKVLIIAILCELVPPDNPSNFKALIK